MIRVTRLNTIMFILMFLLFAFVSKLFTLIHIKIAGIEYLIWFVFATALLLINFVFSSQSFTLKPSYILLLGILFVFCFFNFFVVDVPLNHYLQGVFFTFLFAFNFILFYNIKLSKDDFFLIVNALIFIISVIGLSAYVERIFFVGEYNSFFLRGVSTLAKDPAFAASLLNINIVLCLVMYSLRRKRKYIFLAIFSFITIALLLFLKSLIAALIIFIIFINYFYSSRIVKYFIYVVAALSVLFFIFLSKPLVEEFQYKFNLYFGAGAEKIPRNALYLASFKMAKDHFPFGSGQGTFGSYPVGKQYSQIYYDYDLDKLHGLGPDDALGKTDSHFIFDTYWTGILGEMGFVASFFYLWLWWLPALKSFNYLRSKDLEAKALSFIITMITASIFIESIAAPTPGQLQFIVLYTGLCAVALRLLLHNKTDYQTTFD